METMKEGTLDIAKECEKRCIMNRTRSSHELINQMNNIGDIKSCNNEIDKATNKLSIKISIG